MEMLCPECMGTLVTDDGQSARCTTHGGQFRILFMRWEPQPAPPLPEAPLAESTLQPGAMCVQHPNVPAVLACRHCGAAVCGLCVFTQPDGSPVCPQCASQSSGGVQSAPANYLAPKPRSALPEGVRCVQHSNLQATAQCRSCGAFMCATCDFELPGGIHVCPACATAPRTTLSSRRKRLLVGSFALAVWSTLGMAVLFSGALAEMGQTKEGEKMLGAILSLFLLIPSIIGLALGCSAMDRRLSNAPAIWAAVIWNGIILAAFVLLCVVGTFMK